MHVETVAKQKQENIFRTQNLLHYTYLSLLLP